MKSGKQQDRSSWRLMNPGCSFGISRPLCNVYDASRPIQSSPLKLPTWRYVYHLISIFTAQNPYVIILVVGPLKLVDCGCSHLHHLRPGPKAQDQNMGSYDRTVRQRRKDARAISISVPRRLAVQRPAPGRMECVQRDSQAKERFHTRATGYVLILSLKMVQALNANHGL